MSRWFSTAVGCSAINKIIFPTALRVSNPILYSVIPPPRHIIIIILFNAHVRGKCHLVIHVFIYASSGTNTANTSHGSVSLTWPTTEQIAGLNISMNSQFFPLYSIAFPFLITLKRYFDINLFHVLILHLTQFYKIILNLKV